MQTVIDLLIICCMFVSLSVSPVWSFSNISNQIKPLTEEFEIWEWSQNPLFLNSLGMGLGFNFVSFKTFPGRLHTQRCQSVFCLLLSFCPGFQLASGVPWLVWRAQGGGCASAALVLVWDELGLSKGSSRFQCAICGLKHSSRQKKTHPDLVEQHASNQRNMATLETSSRQF